MDLISYDKLIELVKDKTKHPLIVHNLVSNEKNIEEIKSMFRNIILDENITINNWYDFTQVFLKEATEANPELGKSIASFSKIYLSFINIILKELLKQEKQKQEDKKAIFNLFIESLLNQFAMYLVKVLFVNGILEFMEELSTEYKVIFYSKLLPHCINTYNSYLLNKLTSLNPELTKKVIETELDAKQQIQHNLLLKQEQSRHLKFSQQMAEFTNGFGHVTYEGALLTCAQIKKRKPYHFDPIVLRTYELKEFFQTLKNKPLPTRAKFIISDKHWVCGDILIERGGKVRALILDSLGAKKEQISEEMISLLYVITDEFSDTNVYLARTKRQNAKKGCSIFSIDDVMHFYTLERYLTTKNLFSYLEEQKDNNRIQYLSNCSVIFCSLPVSLYRTMQSRKFFDLPGIDNGFVNKKGETARSSVNKTLKIEGAESIPRNARLDCQLAKIAEYNARYLGENSSENVQKESAAFTLDAFKKPSAMENEYKPVINSETPSTIGFNQPPEKSSNSDAAPKNDEGLFHEQQSETPSPIEFKQPSAQSSVTVIKEELPSGKVSLPEKSIVTINSDTDRKTQETLFHQQQSETPSTIGFNQPLASVTVIKEELTSGGKVNFAEKPIVTIYSNSEQKTQETLFHKLHSTMRQSESFQFFRHTFIKGNEYLPNILKHIEKIKSSLEILARYPQKELYRLIVEGDKLQKENGWVEYEKRQPGCLESFFSGLALAITDIEHLQLDIQTIRNLHKACTQGIKGNNETTPGEFRASNIEMSFEINMDSATEEGILELLDMIEAEKDFPFYQSPGLYKNSEWGIANDQKLFFHTLEENRKKHNVNDNKEFAKKIFQDIKNGSQYVYVAPFMVDPFTKKLEKVIEDYNEQISTAEDNKKLEIIIDLVYKLEHLHPFNDANIRTFAILLLTRLLIQHGFPPPTFKDPNIFDAYSKKELLKEINQAMTNTLNITQGEKNLFGFFTKNMAPNEKTQHKLFVAKFVEKLEEVIKKITSEHIELDTNFKSNTSLNK